MTNALILIVEDKAEILNTFCVGDGAAVLASMVRFPGPGIGYRLEAPHVR